eukprot:CFRG8370T1
MVFSIRPFLRSRLCQKWQCTGATLGNRFSLSPSSTCYNVQNYSVVVTPEKKPNATIRIGQVQINRFTPRHPENVPVHYTHRVPSQSDLSTLRWIIQKDTLGQDMFLVGPPGPEARRLGLWYAEITGREVEVVTLSKDTTESDLKQRREISDGSVSYVDQAPVRAAVEGRLLVLDGIEKAERNVLPTLNNLLENREMALSDGRFLCNPDRYDKLLANGQTKEQLDAEKLIRVHQDFRVLAIGLPVPSFPGYPLDPPLRSRFQATEVAPPMVADVLRQARPTSDYSSGTHTHTNTRNPIQRERATAKAVKELIALSTSLRMSHNNSAIRTSSARPLYLGHESVMAGARVLNALPYTPVESVLGRVYPFWAMSPEQYQIVREAMERLTSNTKHSIPDSRESYIIASAPKPLGRQDTAVKEAAVIFTLSTSSTSPDDAVSLIVPVGPHLTNSQNASTPITQNLGSRFVATKAHWGVLSDMVVDHSLGRDLCLVGGKGEGKSVMANAFALFLGYETEIIQLFKDMTARDLLQRRGTSVDTGDTIWEMSPLVKAALSGKLAVLDGMHRLPYDTLVVLHRLVYDRELELFDGLKLVGHDRYQTLRDNCRGNAASLRALDKTVRMIHPSFRILALANPDTATATKKWLQSETVPLFSFHQLPVLSIETKEKILRRRFPLIAAETMNSLATLSTRLQQSAQESRDAKTTDLTLSMRQLVRIARQVEVYPNDLREAVERTALSRFLPTAIRDALNDTFTFAGVPAVATSIETARAPITFITDTKTGRRTHVEMGGGVKYPVAIPSNPHLVPHVVFYDIPSHVRIMRDIVKDFSIGNRHVLLIGNQGTGKNKVTDRLLEILNLEREYIQLHRDTTIPSLTLAPTLHNGRVVWEDSALVRAVREGRTLVVDEADKAPVEVVCVLKSLVEDGEMLLSDGRRIVRANDELGQLTSPGSAAEVEHIIPIHPDFRMFVLANRPGYPFLGNDFFRECGDVFSCHVVNNPDKASETTLLESYAPDVPKHIVDRLVSAFDDVREGVDSGVLTYPYSTRELVNVVRHMQKYPQDSLSVALQNVFAFDQFESETVSSIKEIMGHHGIALDDAKDSPVGLQEPQSLLCVSDDRALEFNKPKDMNLKLRDVNEGIMKPLTKRNMSYQFGNRKSSKIESENLRVSRFTEQTWTWKLDMGKRSVAKGLEVTSDGVVHVLADQPWGLHSLHGDEYEEAAFLDLGFIPTTVAVSLSRVPMSVSQDSSVLLSVLPSSQLFKLNPLTGDCVGYTLPDTFRGPPVRMQLLYARPKQNELTLVTPTSGSYFSVYEEGKPDFLLLDLQNEVWSHVFVEGCQDEEIAIKKIQCLNADMFSITTTDGESIVLDVNDKDALRLSSLEKWSSDVKAAECVIGNQRVHAWVDSEGSAIRTTSLPTVQSLAEAPVMLSTYESDPTSTDLPPSWENVTSVKLHKHTNTNINPKNTNSSALLSTSTHVSVLDLKTANLRTLPVATLTDGVNTSAVMESDGQRVGMTANDVLVDIASLPDGHRSMGQVATVQQSGRVRLWEIEEDVLKSGFETWMTMMGVKQNQVLSLDISDNTPNNQLKETEPGGSTNRSQMGGMPGVGKVGVGGEEGGSQGGGGGGGTGGATGTGAGGGEGADKKSDGFGGYSIDPSGSIMVDDDVDAAAVQEMALLALDPEIREQLTQMKKGPNKPGRYEAIVEAVQRPIKQLRVVLESVQAKEKEREWINNQNQGDLDDAKLLDGMMGEENIYKRRGEPDQQMGLHQAKPKRMAFVVDLSASMSRFNDWDKRLDRLADAVVMVMESLVGFEHKYHYSIVGHSGSTPTIPLVGFGKPPSSASERMEVVTKMYGYASGSVSGDNTLNAARLAVDEVVAEEADDYFVFVVSDANVGRYDITPRSFGSILSKDDRVNAFAIFIAEKGAADYLINGLPFGHGFVCEETQKIPTAFKDIFTRATVDN